VFNEDQARLVKFIVENTIGMFLIGADPAEIELLADVVKLYGLMLGGRPWLVEVALWDMLGKAAGKPLYKHWGGTAERLELYASTGEVATPDHSPPMALAARDAGFTAIKLRAHSWDYKDDIRAVEAVREAVGDSMRILVDANQGWALSPIGPRWDFDTALEFARAMADLDVYWLEEPLDRFDFDGLRRLRDGADVQIAGGEMNQGYHEFRMMLEKDCLDVYQPDATLAGGVIMSRQVAADAQAKGRLFSPHTWTTGLGFAINMHIAASVENCPILEYPWEPDSWNPQARDGMLTEPLLAENGYVRLPTKPGLGVELSPAAMKRYAKRL
jgi:L-alanine-DL-glutamate epimerase-like enolase superfamily enzyme